MQYPPLRVKVGWRQTRRPSERFHTVPVADRARRRVDPPEASIAQSVERMRTNQLAQEVGWIGFAEVRTGVGFGLGFFGDGRTERQESRREGRESIVFRACLATDILDFWNTAAQLDSRFQN